MFWVSLRSAWIPQCLGFSHSNRGSAEYAPYLPPTEGRHSIQPLQQRYTWQAVFCAPLAHTHTPTPTNTTTTSTSTITTTPPFPVCVCMCLSSLSFPRKEPRIYECMSRRKRHLQRRMSVSCKQLGGEGKEALLCMCVWVDSSHRNTIQ